MGSKRYDPEEESVVTNSADRLQIGHLNIKFSKSSRPPAWREVGRKEGNRVRSDHRRAPPDPPGLQRGSGGVPPRRPLDSRCIVRPAGASYCQSRARGRGSAWGRCRRTPRPLLGDAGMFILLTAAAAGGGAGVLGGWATAKLALRTRLAVHRVGPRACSVRGGGAAGGGQRSGPSSHSPRPSGPVRGAAWPSRPPAPGPSPAGERRAPRFLVSRRRCLWRAGRGPAGWGRLREPGGRGGQARARRPRDPARGRGGCAGRAAERAGALVRSWAVARALCPVRLGRPRPPP